MSGELRNRSRRDPRPLLLLLIWVITGAVIAGAVLLGAGSAAAQVISAPSGATDDARSELPQELTPELVDSLMSRLTDDEVRQLLSEELHRQAEAQRLANAEEPESQLAQTMARLTEMGERIATRAARWAVALGSLERRRDNVMERLALATNGISGMLFAALGVALVGLGSAWFVSLLTRAWRIWLSEPGSDSYWERVLCNLLVLALELLPVGVFVLVTMLVGSALEGPLGPLNDYLWIYHSGVSTGWGFLVIVRRAFSPDAPALNITGLDTASAQRVMQIARPVVAVSVAGWLLAGLSPVIGLGFPPAMVTVATMGTIAAGMLLGSVIRHRHDIRETVGQVLFEGDTRSLGSRLLTTGAPFLAGAYVVIGYIYWVAHWLETGTQRLTGPGGTLIVLLAIPVLDRLGPELIRSVLPGTSHHAERYRRVLSGACRLLIGIVAAGVILALWGIDVLTIAKGENAPAWASAAFDVLLTLLLAHLAWRMISATLYHEKRVSSGEDVEDSVVDTAGSRLDTLIPLVRTLLFGIIAVIVAMIVLSSLGTDIGPLLASAGIIGIAVGFGAQTLVRDIISGAFFLIDDAFRVGEYIELDQDLRGEVEAITIRSLQLRHHRGPVVTVPFGELRAVTNHNRDWVIYKMSFRMEPETDPKVFKKLVKAVGAEFMEHPEHGPKFLEPLKSQGVLMIDDDSAMVFRVKFKCRPRAQFVLRREIYHRLREVFAENNLELARRKVEVITTNEEDGAPGGALGGAATPELIGAPAARPSQ